MSLVDLEPSMICFVLGLCGPDDRIDLAELHALTRKGFPSSVISAVRDLGFTMREISLATGIPARTLVRRMSEKRLTAVESNQFVRIAAFIADAPFLDQTRRYSAMDAPQAFAVTVRWLHKPNRRLGKVEPLTLLDTAAGVEMLCNALSDEHQVESARAVLATQKRKSAGKKRRVRKSRSSGK